MVKKKDEGCNQNEEINENLSQFDLFLDHLFQPSTLKPLFDKIEKMVNEAFPFPHITLDSYETNEEFIIYGHLPGIKKEQIIIDLFERYVTVKIEHQEHREAQTNEQHSFEKVTTLGNVSKTFLLPHPIYDSDLQATFINNELTIKIPVHKKRLYIEE